MVPNNLRFPQFVDEWLSYELNELCYFLKGSNFSKSNLSKEGRSIILYGELYPTYKNEIINSITS